MTAVLNALASFFLLAVTAVFAQNAVFSRALGVSRLVRLVGDSAVSNRTFGLLLGVILLISSPLAWLCSQAMTGWEYRRAVRPLLFILCATLAYLLLMFLFQWRLAPDATVVIAVVRVASLPPALVGPLLIADTQSFTLPQTLGFAVGSAVGYMLAVAIVAEGQRKLQSESVPAPFRGLPITLIYIGILALAIYGFTGHMVSI